MDSGGAGSGRRIAYSVLRIACCVFRIILDAGCAERGDGPVGEYAFGTAPVAAAFGGRRTQPGDRLVRRAVCGGLN